MGTSRKETTKERCGEEKAKREKRHHRERTIGRKEPQKEGRKGRKAITGTLSLLHFHICFVGLFHTAYVEVSMLINQMQAKPKAKSKLRFNL